MSINRIVGWIVLSILSIAWTVPQVATAITLRDDIDEADYIAHGADPLYAAAGVFTGTSTCTASGGTLIHPEWTITAAHCLNASADFILGGNRNAPELQIPVMTTERNPNASGNVADGNDLGVSHLSSPVLDVTPIRIYRSNQELQKIATVIGYGRTGLGSTGEDTLSSLGVRRGSQNRVDNFGAAFGFNIGIMITDFDNHVPTPGDNPTGSNMPLDLEGGIALFDSGSGWFMEINGLPYLVGVTSFRFATQTDGNANSDYGDLFGGTRVSRELAWLDGAHDQTQFWDQSTGNWDTDSRWLPGSQPTNVNAAVIDGGVVNVVDSGAVAEYTFVAGYQLVDNPQSSFGTLSLQEDFTTDHLIVRDNGRLEVAGAAARS